MRSPTRPMPYPVQPTEDAASKEAMTGGQAGEHDRALGLALRLLGQREHGRAELQAKLKARGCPGGGGRRSARWSAGEWRPKR